MEALFSAVGEFLLESGGLARRSLRPVAWILVVTALLDFDARWLLSQALVSRRDAMGATQVMMGLAAAALFFIGLWILSTVFLLLLHIQDRLDRGMPTGLRDSFQALRRRMGPLAVSSIVQGAIVVVPPMILVMASTERSLSAATEGMWPLDVYRVTSVAHAAVTGSLGAVLVWVTVTSVLLLFALPFLLLENRGPLRSIGLSIARVFGRARAEWRSFFACAILWVLIAAAILVPLLLMQRTIVVAPQDRLILTVLSWAWRSAACALSIPWCSAGVVVLFRRLVPSTP